MQVWIACWLGIWVYVKFAKQEGWFSIKEMTTEAACDTTNKDLITVTALIGYSTESLSTVDSGI